jgi:hypothetical protein
MNMDPRNPLKPRPGDYYVGVDLGQKRDYTVVAVVEKKDSHITLRYIKRFPLGTEYTTILDYLKRVQEEFETVHGFYIDQTGVGEVFVENARKHGLHNVQGIVLTMPMKQEVMTCIKQMMLEKRLHLPRDHELEIEMNGEIAEITSTGKTKFYHRTGTHDDRLWALGLAAYGARNDIPRYHPVVVLGSPKDFLGRIKKPDWTDLLRKLRGETQQDTHDQSLTRTNLSARILRRDPRAIIGVSLPPVRALKDDPKTAEIPKRMCPVDGSLYIFEPGKDSPCGHVKADGTIVP